MARTSSEDTSDMTVLDVDVLEDLVFATAGGRDLVLDLYRPATAGPVPAVVYLHGGGWVRGYKRDGGGARPLALAGAGVAVASVGYRLAPDVAYPALLHDCKAAVRWLRSHGDEHRLFTKRVGAWGASAGGYLATMLGLTVGDPELEGELGADQDASSAVDAVVAWFTLGDLAVTAHRSALERVLLPSPAVSTLFGRAWISPEDPDLVSANPRVRASRDAPPFLIAHGDWDHVLPEAQGRMLHDALVRAGADSTFLVRGGAGHEDDAFDAPASIALTAAWLRAHLL